MANRKRNILIIIALISILVIGLAFNFLNLNDVYSTNRENKTVSKSEYKKIIEEELEDLKEEKSIGDYRFSFEYRPIEQIILKESDETTINQTFFDEEKRKLEDLQYYTMRILPDNNTEDVLKTGLENRSGFDERLNYFSFNMQHDIYLVDKGDTLPCILFHFERTFGVTGDCSFSLAFKNKINEQTKNISGSRTLVYKDKVLGCGIVKLSIKEKNIRKIPKQIII